MTVEELIKSLQTFPLDCRIRVWVENPDMQGCPVVDSHLDDATHLLLKYDRLEGDVQLLIIDQS